MIRIIVYIALIVMMAQTPLLAADCLPDKSVSHSPNKRYSIIRQEPTDGETHHLLFDNDKEKKVFFEFERSVCICWEPSSEYFALTYHAGSNVSEVYVYSSVGPKKLFDVLDILPPSIRKLYADNFHSYIEVLSWSKSGLLVHAWGYGSRSFDEKLVCMKKDAEWRCVRKETSRGSS